MEINNIQRRNNGNKTVLITIRITPQISKWLREKNYSPTGIFYEALKDLGYQEAKNGK